MRNASGGLLRNLCDASEQKAMQPAASPTIDCHAHIYTHDMPLAPDAWHRPQHDATLEMYQSTLAAHGVAFGVLAAASIYDDANSYALAATRRHPNLKTTVILPEDFDEDQVTKMADDGVVGVRLQWLRKAKIPDLASPKHQRLLHLVRELDWHVELHDSGVRLPDSIAKISAAGVKLVIDHFGRPNGDSPEDRGAFDAILDAVADGRTWVKISAAFRLSSQRLASARLEDLLGMNAAPRLLWGSDWPFAGFESAISYEDCLATFRSLAPDPDVRRQIDEAGLSFYFGQTTTQISGLSAPTSA